MIGQRLTHSQVKEVRQQQFVKQGGICCMCGQRMKLAQAVLDHCHKTGAVRGTAHRSCNSLLGKVENNAVRFGVHDIYSFLFGTASYLQLHKTNITGLIHPTHKTDEEKRLLRNKRAVAARAKKKKT